RIIPLKITHKKTRINEKIHVPSILIKRASLKLRRTIRTTDKKIKVKGEAIRIQLLNNTKTKIRIQTKEIKTEILTRIKEISSIVVKRGISEMTIKINHS